MKNKTKTAIYSLALALPFILNGNSHHNKEGTDITAALISSKEKITLESARKNYLIRQKYLDSLLEKTSIPYCLGAVYDHHGTKIVDYLVERAAELESPEKINEVLNEFKKQFIEGDYDVKTPEILELSAKKQTSKIFIGRKIFEELLYLQDEDIKHIIVAHEGRHVEQHALGLEYLAKEEIIEGIHNGSIRLPVIYNAGEMDANAHGLIRIASGEFKVNKPYLITTIESYLISRQGLVEALKTASPIEQRLISNAINKVNSFSQLRVFNKK